MASRRTQPPLGIVCIGLTSCSKSATLTPSLGNKAVSLSRDREDSDFGGSHSEVKLMDFVGGVMVIWTKYYIQNEYIYGPEMSGRFYVQDGYIYGPRNGGKYYIQNGYIYGPNSSGRFYIQVNYIYGPSDEELPWLRE